MIVGFLDLADKQAQWEIVEIVVSPEEMVFKVSVFHVVRFVPLYYIVFMFHSHTHRNQRNERLSW